MKAPSGLTLAMLGLALLVLFSGRIGGCTTPFNPPPAPGETLIIMLYEAEHGQLPDYAVGAARDLVAAKIKVRPVDDDQLQGLGAVPVWLKPVLEEGRKIMGGSADNQQLDDALIKLVGERMDVAIKLPATKEAILEAVR